MPFLAAPAGMAIATLIGGTATAGAAAYGAHSNSSAANRSAAYQSQQAKYAADLEAKASADALQFAKEQEAQRQKEWMLTQDRNRAIYDAEVGRDDLRYQTRQNNLAPYRQFGAGSLGQLMRPIPGVGSLADRMGG